MFQKCSNNEMKNRRGTCNFSLLHWGFLYLASRTAEAAIDGSVVEGQTANASLRGPHSAPKDKTTNGAISIASNFETRKYVFYDEKNRSEVIDEIELMESQLEMEIETEIDSELLTYTCDDIQDWHDSDGDKYDCGWYSRVPNACEDFGDDLSNYGHTANTACCFCKSKVCMELGSPCMNGTTCGKCCDGFEYWDSMNTTACGLEPCYKTGTCDNTLRPDQLEPNDVCKDGDTFVACNTSKFEVCEEDFMLCYYRRPSNSSFYDVDNIHPIFYIDPLVAKCVPQFNYEKDRWWDCDRCTGHIADTGAWCRNEGHCMTEENSRCLCGDKVKDAAKAEKRRSWCKDNGYKYEDELFKNLENGQICFNSTMCQSGCCLERENGRHKCRSFKASRTCI